jgi:hypothetical protein
MENRYQNTSICCVNMWGARAAGGIGFASPKATSAI